MPSLNAPSLYHYTSFHVESQTCPKVHADFFIFTLTQSKCLYLFYDFRHLVHVSYPLDVYLKIILCVLFNLWCRLFLFLHNWKTKETLWKTLNFVHRPWIPQFRQNHLLLNILFQLQHVPLRHKRRIPNSL